MKHIFTPDMIYTPESEELRKEFKSVIIPLVQKYIDEGFPQTEIGYYIHDLINYEMTLIRLEKEKKNA